jgi:shikimate dehydrogenase
MTISFGVVGNPISHSLSPLLHRAVYREANLDFDYQPHLVEQGNLSHFFESGNFAGLSVTMPLKDEAFAMSEGEDESWLLTKSCNTLIKAANKTIGYNTDVLGIEESLRSVESVNQISLIGSGATARSAAVAISRLFPSAMVRMVARNKDAALEIVELFQHLGQEAELANESLEAVMSSDLCISTVPQSAVSELWQAISVQDTREKTLFDVSYNPWPSHAANSWKGEVISGIEMLKWQAARQIEHFCSAVEEDLSLTLAEMYEIMSIEIANETSTGH